MVNTRQTNRFLPMSKLNAAILIKNILGVWNRALLTERDWSPNYPKVRDGEFVIVEVLLFVGINLQNKFGNRWRFQWNGNILCLWLWLWSLVPFGYVVISQFRVLNTPTSEGCFGRAKMAVNFGLNQPTSNGWKSSFRLPYTKKKWAVFPSKVQTLLRYENFVSVALALLY